MHIHIHIDIKHIYQVAVATSTWSIVKRAGRGPGFGEPSSKPRWKSGKKTKAQKKLSKTIETLG